CARNYDYDGAMDYW
nr:immunoglobulin heavy chain junction region [Mus musculus]